MHSRFATNLEVLKSISGVKGLGIINHLGMYGSLGHIIPVISPVLGHGKFITFNFDLGMRQAEGVEHTKILIWKVGITIVIVNLTIL